MNGFSRLDNERYLVVNGWEVVGVAPAVNGEGVYLTLNSATRGVRQLMAAYLLQVAGEE